MKSTLTLFQFGVCLALLLLAPLVHAQDFILPGGPLPPDCSANGSTVTCTSDVEIGDDEVVAINGPVDWVIEGKLDVGEGAMVNDGGAAGDLNIEVTGDNKVDIKGSINGNLTAEDEVKVKDGGTINGDVTAEDEVKVKDGGTINGDVTAEGTEGEVKVEDGGTINGDVTAKGMEGEVKVKGDGATINGDVTAEGADGEVKVEDGGTINGDVTAKGEVKLENNASVEGNVDAADKVEIKDDSSVGGTVTSDNGDVEIKEDSTVSGDVIALNGTVDIEEGSEVVGCVYSANLNNNGTIVCDKALPVFDDFKSYPAGSIVGQDGGTGWGDAWESAGGQTIIDTTTNPLLFEDSQGRFIRSETTLEISGNNDRVAARKLDGTFTGDQLFMSMLVRYQGQPGNNDFLGFWTESSGFGDSPQFGVKTNEGGRGQKDFFVQLDTNAKFSTELQPGDTYLLVAEFVKDGQEFFNKGQLWVNPECNQTPPATPSAQIAGNPNSQISEVSELGLRSVNLGNDQSIEVGQVAAGENWTDVVDCSPPQPEPILEYRMDEGTWSGAESVLDATGNDRHASPVNGASPDGATPLARSGNPGTCGYGTFNGADQQAEDTDAGSYLNGLNAVTVSTWVFNTDSLAGNDRGIFFTDNAPNGKDHRLGMRYDVQGFNNGGIKAGIQTTDCGDGNDCVQVETQSNVMKVNEWQHVAMTWETGGELRIYVDGQDVTDPGSEEGWGTDGSIDAVSGLFIGQGGKGDLWQGRMDEFRVYDQALTPAQVESVFLDTHPCPADVVDHYKISHSGQGVTCLSTDVTITAYDSADNPVDPGTARLDLSTTTGKGDWAAVSSGSGTLSNVGASGDGQAEYVFPGGESSVILALNYTDIGAGNSETFNIDVDDGSATDRRDNTDPEDPDITFALTGFRFANINDANTTIPTQLSGKRSDTGYNSRTLALQAIHASDSDPAQCNAAFPDGSDRDIEIAAECRNPTTCAGEQIEIRNNGNTNTVATNNDNGGASTGFSGTIPLRFTESTISGQTVSQAEIALRYADAGLMQLHARYNIPLEDDTPSGDFMAGSSNDFVVRPFGFFLDFDPDGDTVFNDQTNNASCAAQTSCAGGAGDDVFATAGADFPVHLKAVVWESGNDGDNDGIPDSNQAIKNNAITPNFGNEGATVDLSHTLVAPGGGSSGNLSGATGIGGFAGGDETVTGVAWSEVGIIDLDANLAGNDYLASGDDVIGSAPNLGRFIPADFAVSVRDAGMYEATCSGTFSYVGEPFGYAMEPMLNITARNAGGATTENYRGNFIKLGGAGVNVTPPPSDASAIGDVSGTIDVAVTAAFNTGAVADDGNGVLVYTFNSGDSYTYDKVQNARIDKFNADLPITVDDVTDGDGVTNGELPSPNPFTPTGAEIRYGRLHLDNTFGPETLDLTVPMRAQFLDSGRFTLNTDESCWVYDTDNDVTLDQSGLSGGSTSVVSVTDSLVAGEPMSGSELVLTSPGEGNTGQVGVTFGVPVWLQEDFDGDGSLDNPTATATFGVFRGHDRVIYWREAE